MALATPLIAGAMPQGWVHKELKSGQAVVLVDGLDEVPVLQRDSIRDWLKELVEIYPEARFIVTSRSYLVKDGWMDVEGFSYAELQPMELSDINTFIEFWHKAVAEELWDEEAKEEFSILAQSLKKEILFDRAKRTLASNPLLCAMLCALHREQRNQLPTDRLELYDACCKLLIERRDKEQLIPLTDYPAAVLNYRQKLALLQDLAYWLVRNERSEIALQSVDERFSRKLLNMQGIPPGLLGSDVHQLFVERTSILREPVVGQIEFTHHTFQEFLAAQAAIEDDDVDLLLHNAHNEGWREVIILAAGLATKAVREHLIRGLLSRGDKEPTHRYQLHLLAVSCLETVVVHLSPNLRKEVENRLGELIPPKNLTDVKALSSAKELAVPHLIRRSDYPPSTTVACVRTLSLIGGDAALETLKSYAEGEDQEIIDELLRAWAYFDREQYAREILSRSLRNRTDLSLDNLPSIDGIQYFTHLRTLSLSNCKEVDELTHLSGLVQLTSLALSGCSQVRDLSPLTGLTQLVSLDLSSCDAVSDLTPLQGLAELNALSLYRCESISDLTPLQGLAQLRSLNLYLCERIHDSRQLESLTQIRSLNVSYCSQLRDPSFLANLTNLTSLDLSFCSQVSDLNFLANLLGLTSLNLSACRKIRDITPLAKLTGLKDLSLSFCSQLSDITPLASLEQLTLLDISGCVLVSDITPLEKLKQLTWLDISGCPRIVDRRPLKTLSKLALGSTRFH